jgi:hypothetical protein
LLATQIISRLSQSFQINLPLRTLFESPTVRELTRSIEVALRGSEPAMPAPPLQPVSRDQLLPLSYAQQRLWFVDQVEPNQPHFNNPRAMRMNGALNVAALEQSLSEITRRHEVLRTTFTSINDEPCQIIAPFAPITLPVIDLSHLKQTEREPEAHRLANEEAVTPFDLSRGPLVRLSLLKLSSDEHVLLLTKHHIVTDRWSIGLFIEELMTLYTAFSAGKPLPLPELPVQYADHAVWQRNWLQGEVLDRDLDYWRKQLAGAPAVLNLPLDRPRPSRPSLRGAIHEHTLSPALTTALRKLSQEEGCTLFMTLTTLLKSLLFYHAGHDRIVVGTDVANRNRIETEKLCGFFVNHLVLSTNMTGDPTFRELMSRVREVALGAYAHQDVPFEKLVEALKPDRASAYSPLFQVLCVHQNTPHREFELPGLTIRPLELRRETAKYDLGLFVEESAEGLVLLWNYKTDLFEPQTIGRLAIDFETLTQVVITNRDERLSSLAALLARTHQQQRVVAEQAFVASGRRKLKATRRRAVSR